MTSMFHRASGKTLSESVADSLRERLDAGEWKAGEKLPTEHELGAQYEVSRATVRTALRALDGRGRTVTVHGLGTFATAAASTVAADLQRLESISQTIVGMGREPSSIFRSIALRPATTIEITALSLDDEAVVLATEREIMADGETVAYSHDAIPMTVLHDDFDVRSVSGSLFSLLTANSVEVSTSLTNVHASTGADIGWAKPSTSSLYVLLEQAHFDQRSRGVAYSRTWFIEGRFQFSIVRTR